MAKYKSADNYVWRPNHRRHCRLLNVFQNGFCHQLPSSISSMFSF